MERWRWYRCRRCNRGFEAPWWQLCLCGSWDVEYWPEPKGTPPGQVEMLPLGLVDGDLVHPEASQREACMNDLLRLREKFTPTRR